MLAELANMRQRGDRRLIAQVKASLLALNHAAQTFLNREIQRLDMTLARDDKDQKHPSELNLLTTTRLIRNGLHAAVRPIAELIERFGDDPDQRQLGMLLRAGMIPCLQAVDAIAGELTKFTISAAHQSARKEDFGVPGAD
jgi:hypothetical protein